MSQGFVFPTSLHLRQPALDVISVSFPIRGRCVLSVLPASLKKSLCSGIGAAARSTAAENAEVSHLSIETMNGCRRISCIDQSFIVCLEAGEASPGTNTGQITQWLVQCIACAWPGWTGARRALCHIGKNRIPS